MLRRLNCRQERDVRGPEFVPLIHQLALEILARRAAHGELPPRSRPAAIHVNRCEEELLNGRVEFSAERRQTEAGRRRCSPGTKPQTAPAALWPPAPRPR